MLTDLMWFQSTKTFSHSFGDASVRASFLEANKI